MFLEVGEISRVTISGIEYGEKIGNQIDQHQRPGVGKPARSWSLRTTRRTDAYGRRVKILHELGDNKTMWKIGWLNLRPDRADTQQ